MHFQFKAKLGQREISILVSKDMSVQEMLDALSYALQLSPFSQIVGFRDPNAGLIIPPSIVCSDPDQINNNETYEVMIRQIASQPFQSSLGGLGANERGGAIQSTNQSSSNPNTQLGETQASFNARVGTLQHAIGQVNLSGSGGPQQPGATQNGTPNEPQPLAESSYRGLGDQAQQPQVRTINPAQNMMRDQQQQQQQLYQRRTNFSDQAHSRQPSTAPAGVERERQTSQYTQETKDSMIQLIQSWQTDALLTDQLKVKIIQKVQSEDNGIMGAYRLFLTDRDLEGFKARIIHKVLGGHLGTAGNNTNLTLSAEERQSSMTTAGFNRSADYLSRFSRGSTGPAGGGTANAFQQNQGVLGSGNMRPSTNATNNRFQSRIVRPTTADESQAIESTGQNNQIHHIGGQGQHQSSQDRYLPIIINLESSNLLDEQTSSLLKTLILEENLDVFRLINSFIARAIDEQELCAKLIRLAQQMGTYMERPVSPIPKNKKQLLQFVNSLTRYHFSDKEDIELLNKLIQEENEFVLSCFDVFDSDKDHENLIDSLHRILDKSKANGMQYQKITPAAFYQNYENGQAWPINTANQHQLQEQKLLQYARETRAYTHQTPQPNHSFGIAATLHSANVDPFVQSHAALRPETSHWNERILSHQQSSQNPYNPALVAQRENMFVAMQPGVRSQSFAKSDAAMRGGNQRDRPMLHISRGSQNPNHRRRDRSHPHMVGGIANNNPQFKPLPTTVHNVPLISNYFSSGEEDNGGQIGQNSSSNPYQHYKNQPRSFQQMVRVPQSDSHSKYAQQVYGAPNMNIRGNYVNNPGLGHYSGDQGFYGDRGPKANQAFRYTAPNRPGKHPGYMLRGGPGNARRAGPGYQINNFILDSQDEQQQHSRFTAYSDSHQPGSGAQLDQQQLEQYLTRLGTNFMNMNSQIIVDDYGDEIYGPNLMASHMSHNMPPSAPFFSGSKNDFPGARLTMGKKQPPRNRRKPERRRRRNGKKARHGGKKYSSEDDLSASYDENEDDDINRGGTAVVSQSNYRKNEASYMSGSSESSEGTSQESQSSESSSSSEGSSVSKKRKKEDEKKEKPAKKGSRAKRKRRGKKQWPGSIKPKPSSQTYQPHISSLKPASYHKIIADERLATKLSPDNYTILLHLANEGDPGVRAIFRKHLKHIKKYGGSDGDFSEQSLLLSELLSKTEETYQALLEGHLDSKQQSIIRKMRSMKAEGYQNIFGNIINQGAAPVSIGQLIQDLKNFAENTMRVEEQQEIKFSEKLGKFRNSQQQQHNSQIKQLAEQPVQNKEKVEEIFLSILYKSFRGNEEKEQFLRQQFESESPELMQILSQHLIDNDDIRLKTMINAFVLKYLGPDVYKNLKDAINGLHEKGHLQERDRDLIRTLSLQGDKHLLASWDAYTVMKDEEDLADNFQILCDVKRQKKDLIRSNEEPAGPFEIQRMPRKQSEMDTNLNAFSKQQHTSKRQPVEDHNRGANEGKEDDSLERDENNDAQNDQESYEQHNQPMRFSRLMGQSAAPNDHGAQEDAQKTANMMGQGLQPGNSPQASSKQDQPLEPGDGVEYPNGGDDQEYHEDIDGIMQFQHKILRKYGMLGMIHFQAIPFFHQLVNERDYKMICIFEVFAQNRNEDDFLENLGILNDIRLQTEEQQVMYQEGDDDVNAGQLGGSSDSGNDHTNLPPDQNHQMSNQQPQQQVYNQPSSQANQQMSIRSEFERQAALSRDLEDRYPGEPAGCQRGPAPPAKVPYNRWREPQQEPQRSYYGHNVESERSAQGGGGAVANTGKGTGNQSLNDQGANLGDNGSSEGMGTQPPLGTGVSPGPAGPPPPKQNDNESLASADPNVQVLLSIKDKVSPDVFNFIKEKLQGREKKVLAVFKCYHKNRDEADMINTMQRLHSKMNK